ncbi:hypothetical protein TcBrA4_0010850 [Trypanosoma cruzi]|nr:hypothetical protein TcBrA4_0010850 [Trypanosoma cruzi]
MLAAFADVRSNECPLCSTVKSFSVRNGDACGDHPDSAGEVSDCARKAMRGATPPFVPQISDCSSLLCIYNEGEALVCDQRLCYVTIEAPIEVRSITTAAHPRLELCPAHRSFVAGAFWTDSNGFDGAFTAFCHAHLSAAKCANRKPVGAMRQLQAA